MNSNKIIINIDTAPGNMIDILATVIAPDGSRHVKDGDTQRTLCGEPIDPSQWGAVVPMPVYSLCRRCHQRHETAKRGSLRNAWGAAAEEVQP